MESAAAPSDKQCSLYWYKIFPFLRWLPMVNRHTLRADAVAGLTGAILVLPQGVAFAAIAGMPPEYGLYAAMVPAIIAALFGSSWHLVSGPTTAASIVLFASLSTFAEPASSEFVSLAITLTLMVGIIQFVMGMVRLGTLVNFISHSVVVGFTAGAAILIGTSQIKNFFGLEMERGLHFHEMVMQFFSRLSEINPYVTGIAVATLVTGILVKRFIPRVPYMIAALAMGSVVAAILNNRYSAELTGISSVGALPASLPPLSAPDLSLETIRQLAPVAVAATLLALTEAVSIARSLAVRSGQRLDGNQEFLGQGLSNIVGSFFSSYVATGSFNRSGVNYDAGARTPLAAAFAGVMLMGIVILVAPYAYLLPNAAMAGILFLVAWGLIDFHHIRHILRASGSETGVLATTFFSTLFLELELAIMLGVMLSLIIYLSRTSRPQVLPRVPDPSHPKRAFTTNSSLATCPQFKIIRIDGSLFFGAVDYVEQRFQAIDPREHLLVVAKGMNFVDMAGAELLAKEASRRRQAGGKLYLYEVKDKVCNMLRRTGLITSIGDENIFNSKTRALECVINDHLDHAVCRTCRHRVFNECEKLAVREANA
ncbi:SulP family inorganic anion transporter [Thiohalomonas denitrificans]|uniref:Sulfate permease, SulP family n=1 Tax=Thiohalomonas denitrificans TaxID=415747 RepID=A0A1G5Q0E0_9GAMM|nr:SulP family inorganic anion transporter [Thiohalomonas denitrificans]SCZ54940.1 sulfate permease, SulP family [Thiohalomonas denitrificans]